MILHIHPKEIESHLGKSIVEKLKNETGQEVVRPEDKTPEAWRAIIDRGEVITIVAPVYWWGLSYEFDKWFQDVFSFGWAFDYTKQPTGLLQGKRVIVHLTHGTPTEYAGTMFTNIKERLDKGVFGYCGMEMELHFHEQKHG